MYKECPKFKKSLYGLKEVFDEYDGILSNAQKVEDFQDIESVQISLDNKYMECLNILRDILRVHYKEWILNSKLNAWGTRDFHYNYDTHRMEIDTIDLSTGSITYLPKCLTIKGNLDMSLKSNHSLKDLPDDLIVEGKLIIWWRDPLIHKARLSLGIHIGEIVEDMSN